MDDAKALGGLISRGLLLQVFDMVVDGLAPALQVAHVVLQVRDGLAHKLWEKAQCENPALDPTTVGFGSASGIASRLSGSLAGAAEVPLTSCIHGQVFACIRHAHVRLFDLRVRLPLLVRSGVICDHIVLFDLVVVPPCPEHRGSN